MQKLFSEALEPRFVQFREYISQSQDIPMQLTAQMERRSSRVTCRNDARSRASPAVNKGQDTGLREEGLGQPPSLGRKRCEACGLQRF